MSLQGDVSLLSLLSLQDVSLLSLLPGHCGSVGRSGAAAASFCPCGAPGCLERGSRASPGLEELLVPRRGWQHCTLHFLPRYSQSTHPDHL